jgi:hypothetical protein
MYEQIEDQINAAKLTLHRATSTLLFPTTCKPTGFDPTPAHHSRRRTHTLAHHPIHKSSSLKRVSTPKHTPKHHHLHHRRNRNHPTSSLQPKSSHIRQLYVHPLQDFAKLCANRIFNRDAVRKIGNHNAPSESERTIRLRNWNRNSRNCNVDMRSYSYASWS